MKIELGKKILSQFYLIININEKETKIINICRQHYMEF